MLVPLGRYERPERELLRTYIEPARPVIELGGGLGVIASLINRRLHDPERHVVVEANPSLLPVIDANRRRNDARFSIVHGAIAYGGTTVWIEIWHRLPLDDRRASRRRPSRSRAHVAGSIRGLYLRRCGTVCDIEGAKPTWSRTRPTS